MLQETKKIHVTHLIAILIYYSDLWLNLQYMKYPVFMQQLKNQEGQAGVAQWLSINLGIRRSQSGHMLRLWARSLVGSISSRERAGGRRSMLLIIDISISLSLPLPISEMNKNILRK